MIFLGHGMKRKYLILCSLSGVVLCLDQLLKFLVHQRMEEGGSNSLLGGLLALTHVRNMGFAFGSFGKLPASLQDVFFIAIPVFALVLILLIFIKLRDDQMLTSVALTTILSGAVGNLIDRIQYGYVIDVVFLQLRSWKSGAFNVADISIVVGVALMFLATLLQDKRGRQTA